MKGRHTAYFARINELQEGVYSPGDENNPSSVFIAKRQLRVARVNLLGFVISIDDENPGYEEFVIDDGSGNIAVRNFDTTKRLEKPEVGKLLNVIGRVREYGNQRYILPEIVKIVEDKRFMEMRYLELGFMLTPKSKEMMQEQEIVKEEEIDETSPNQKVFELIKGLDSGKGVDIQELKQKSGLAEIDKILQMLIETGEIFKISPERVKAL